MASTYAHYCFAHEVINYLRTDIVNDIKKGLDLYNIGLHGPDILFYYKPLKTNPINQIGYSMHEKQAIDFFKICKKLILENPYDYNIKAYTYGFITHFMLDSSVHGYIKKKIEQSGIGHAEIEVEFDREIMIDAGYNPLTKNLTTHIKDTHENSTVISLFYEQINSKQIKKALSSMKYYNNLLLAPSKFKRKFINLLLKISGNYNDMHGLMINYEDNSYCKDSCIELKKRYNNAIVPTAEIIEDFVDNIENNIPLNNRFNKTFGAKDND